MWEGKISHFSFVFVLALALCNRLFRLINEHVIRVHLEVNVETETTHNELTQRVAKGPVVTCNRPSSTFQNTQIYFHTGNGISQFLDR